MESKHLSTTNIPINTGFETRLFNLTKAVAQNWQSKIICISREKKLRLTLTFVRNTEWHVRCNDITLSHNWKISTTRREISIGERFSENNVKHNTTRYRYFPCATLCGVELTAECRIRGKFSRELIEEESEWDAIGARPIGANVQSRLITAAPSGRTRRPWNRAPVLFALPQSRWAPAKLCQWSPSKILQNESKTTSRYLANPTFYIRPEKSASPCTYNQKGYDIARRPDALLPVILRFYFIRWDMVHFIRVPVACRHSQGLNICLMFS